MAKKKQQTQDSSSWKKINVGEGVFEEAGFLGLEEIDPSEYLTYTQPKQTTPTATSGKKEQNKQPQQPKLKAKAKPTATTTTTTAPTTKKRKQTEKEIEKELIKEFSNFEEDDKPIKKKKNVKVDDSGIVDVSQHLLDSFQEGTTKKKINKKKKKAPAPAFNPDDNDNSEAEEDVKDEKSIVKGKQQKQEQPKQQPKQQPQQPQQPKQQPKQQQPPKQQPKDVEMKDVEEQEQEQEEKEPTLISNKDAKKLKNQESKQKKKEQQKKKNLQKIENIKKRKEVSELKTISQEEQDNLDMTEWNEYNLDPLITKALRSLGFSKPTPIQSQVIPKAVSHGYDIIGAAETGSGKTLAFGIPIVNRILQHLRNNNQVVEKVDKQQDEEEEEEKEEEQEEKEEDEEENDEGEEENEDNEEDNEGQYKQEKYKFKKLYALVLCPTRELAIQVTNHIKSIISQTNLKVVSIVGGMASQRQERVLSKRPEIVVATPGRLWELITERHPHLIDLSSLLCLAIDEADRMVEKGHFAELDSILSHLPLFRSNLSKKKKLQEKLKQKQRKSKGKGKKQQQEQEESEDEDDEDDFDKDLNINQHKRQSFVFSATLVGLPNHKKQEKPMKKGMPVKLTPIEELVEKVQFQRDYQLVDCTKDRLTASNLLETKLFCNLDERDRYLYYFVERYPGKTLVFVNSIDCARRLIPILTCLNVPVFPLHAQMQQKQRLKNLDRFRTLDNVVLIATDVAARGLDIPLVQHVIHYQVPRSTELYIHRSGRTARSNQEGISVMLVTPKERNLFTKLDNALQHDIDNFPIDLRYMNGIDERMRIAKEIDQLSYKSAKVKRDKSWFKKAAEEMDIEFDNDFHGGGLDSDSDDDDHSQMNDNIHKGKINQLKNELQMLLRNSLLPRGASKSYITATSLQELEKKGSSATKDFQINIPCYKE